MAERMDFRWMPPSDRTLSKLVDGRLLRTFRFDAWTSVKDLRIGSLALVGDNSVMHAGKVK